MTIVNYDDLMTPLMMCTKKGITHVKNNFLVYFLWTPQIAKRPIKSDTDEYQVLGVVTPLNTDAKTVPAPPSETITTESKITGTMDWIEEIVLVRCVRKIYNKQK
jgi:hypothetical protein